MILLRGEFERRERKVFEVVFCSSSSSMRTKRNCEWIFYVLSYNNCHKEVLEISEVNWVYYSKSFVGVECLLRLTNEVKFVHSTKQPPPVWWCGKKNPPRIPSPRPDIGPRLVIYSCMYICREWRAFKLWLNPFRNGHVRCFVSLLKGVTSFVLNEMVCVLHGIHQVRWPNTYFGVFSFFHSFFHLSSSWSLVIEEGGKNHKFQI